MYAVISNCSNDFLVVVTQIQLTWLTWCIKPFTSFGYVLSGVFCLLVFFVVVVFNQFLSPFFHNL